jgi:hypothetical protein
MTTSSRTVILRNEHATTQVHIIGVAHASPRSNEDVRAVIQATKPQMVLLELCGERQGMLESQWPATPLPELSLNELRQRWRMLIDPIFWALQLPMLGLEALAGSGLGHEQAVGYAEGASRGAQIGLIDRPQSVTLGRTLSGIIDVACDIRTWQMGPSLLMAGLWGAPADSNLAMDIARLRGLAALGASLSDREMAEGQALSRRILEDMVDDPTQAATQTPSESLTLILTLLCVMDIHLNRVTRCLTLFI